MKSIRCPCNPPLCALAFVLFALEVALAPGDQRFRVICRHRVQHQPEGHHRLFSGRHVASPVGCCGLVRGVQGRLSLDGSTLVGREVQFVEESVNEFLWFG